MLKKLTAVLISAFIVVISVPAVRSSATDVTVENTFADICYGYTSDDFLSTPNYDNYFMQNDTSNSDLAIKNSVYKDIFCNNSSSNFGSTMWTLLKDDIDNNMSNIGNTYFADKDGLRFSYFRYNPSTSGVAYFNCVAVGSDDLAIVQNTICSKSSFTVYDVKYNDQGGAFNGSFQFVSENTSGINAELENGLYKYVLMPESSNIRYLYSEMPLYLTYSYNSNYNDLSYLASSPYNYDVVDNVYNSIDNDTTGFVIDRRTEKMIDNSSGGGSSDQIISDGFDPQLFDGTLGFNWFNSNGSTNYVSSLDQYKPFIQLKYKINNYTDIHKDNVSLIWDSEINMKLTYRDSSNVTFITSCRYQASGNWNLIGHENQFTLLAAQESNLYTLKSVRSTSGSNPYGNEFSNTNNINQNISFGISSYRHNSAVVTNSESDTYDLIKDYFSGNKGNRTLDSYGIIYFNVYLKDNVTGETSIIYKSAFDLFNNKFDDNHNDLVNNDDSAYNDFIDSFNYQDDNGDLSLVDYAKPYGYGGSSSQVGDITIYQNPYPYLLVDIPEGEWMSKTPRLTTILNDFKDALSEVKNDSILNVMSETYNYLPVPVWQYFTYGVGILIAIGIWRAITRR